MTLSQVRTRLGSGMGLTLAALHGHHGQGSVAAIPHPLLNLKSFAEVSLWEQHFPKPTCPPSPSLCRGL